LASLLTGDPVDQSAVVAQLRLRRSLADGRSAESLDAAFQEWTGGTSLAEALDGAVAEGRAPETLVEDVLRMTGLVSEFTLGAPPPGPIAVPPKTSPASLPRVQAFVENLHTVLVEHEDAEGAFALLRLLGGDLRQAWAVQEAYQTRYGASIDRHLNDLWGREHSDVPWHRWNEIWPVHGADNLFSETRPDPVSYAQVERWYELLSELTFQHPEFGAVPIPSDHVWEGCALRAHLAALWLLQQGAPAGKIVVVQAHDDGSGALGLRSGDMPNFLDPVRIPWVYHIAAVVWGHDEERRPAWMVVDGATGLGLRTAGEWLTAIGVDPGNERNLFLTGRLDDVRAALWEEFDKAPASWLFRYVPFPVDRAVAVITEARLDSHPLIHGEPTLAQGDAYLRDKITTDLVEHALAMRELRYARRARRVLEELRAAEAPAEEAALRLETELGGASPRRGTLERYADLDRLLRDVLGERYDGLTGELFPAEQPGQEPSATELAAALARSSRFAHADEVTMPSETTAAEEPSPMPSPPPNWPQWTSAPQARPETTGQFSASLVRPEDTDDLPELPVRFGQVYASPSWALARATYEVALGWVLGSDPAVFRAARDAARRLYATLARRMGADAAADGFGVDSGAELERLLGEDSEWTLHDVMTAMYKAVDHHAAALTLMWGDAPFVWDDRTGAWLTEMRDARGYHVASQPSNLTEWALRVYGRLGFEADHRRSFLQAAISYGIAMSQPLFDTLRAADWAGHSDVLHRAVLAGEAADLYAWIDEEFRPRERTGDREVLADLTPPHLLYDVTASSGDGELLLGATPGGLRGGAPGRDSGPIGSEALVTGPRKGGLWFVPARAVPASPAEGKEADRFFVHAREESDPRLLRYLASAGGWFKSSNDVVLSPDEWVRTGPDGEGSRPPRYRVSAGGWFEFSNDVVLSPEGWVRIGADGADFVNMPEGVVLRADTAEVGRVSNKEQLGRMLAEQRFDAVPYTLFRGPAGLYLVPAGAEDDDAVYVPLPEDPGAYAAVEQDLRSEVLAALRS
ncbi:protein-glutamine glutaminase family protein, partial [Actinoallomurus spadix]